MPGRSTTSPPSTTRSARALGAAAPGLVVDGAGVAAIALILAAVASLVAASGAPAARSANSSSGSSSPPRCFACRRRSSRLAVDFEIAGLVISDVVFGC